MTVLWLTSDYKYFGNSNHLVRKTVKLLPPLLEVRHQPVQQSPEFWPMVSHFMMAEFVDNNIVNALFGCLYERQI